MQQFELSQGWQLKPRAPSRLLLDDFASENDWIPANVPGSVHEAIQAAGLIADPFVGTNEQDVQWIGEADWLYRCTFTLPVSQASQPHIDLCFDGLDTYATVWLNNEQVLASDNMFVPQRVDVAGLVQPENTLHILFASALLKGRKQVAEHGERALWNGEPSRLYVRKAQYHWGWDWGPTLLTAGPWRAIRLESYSARIAEIHCPVTLTPDLSSATLPVTLDIDHTHELPLTARIDLFDPDGGLVDHVAVPVQKSTLQHTFTVPQPKLWWPHGYGKQSRYRLAVTLTNTEVCHERSLQLGLRQVRLVQEPVEGESGTSFYFEINNTPIFSGGANWIPDDIPTTKITTERYHAQVARAVEANMSMLRVWGGGIYEDAAFYEACDEQGVLVWQDFLFGCGMYPAMESFQASVRAEAITQVQRLRHHACIVLWCANNEDYSIAFSNNAYDINSPPDAASSFPARVIYEQVLPDVCATFDGTRPYWPGSPYGGAWPDEPTVGDRHVWMVWHGDKAPYQEYPRLEGRFVSEFGMAAFPTLATVEAFAPGETSPESPIIQHHQKAEAGQARILHYMAENLVVPSDLPNFIYASQLVQAEAITSAFAGWRRRWGNTGKRAVGGALVWQLNDCWPTMSWALVDSFGRAKAAYYAARRALAPLAVGMRRTGDRVDMWVVNGDPAPIEAALEVTIWSLDGGEVAQHVDMHVFEANAVTELGPWPEPLAADQVIAARLLVNGTVASRSAAWPEPLKHAPLSDPVIAIERLDASTLQVSATRPAKGAWLHAGSDAVWSDNGFDLLPTDSRLIKLSGSESDPTAFSLFDLLHANR